MSAPINEVWPPSTASSEPVTNERVVAREEQGRRGELDGFPSLPTGNDSPNARICASLMTPLSIGVAIGPGAITFARIPSTAWSTAIDLVSITTPPLLVTYAAISFPTSNAPVVDDTLMIDPPSPARMTRMAARQQLNVPVRLTAITRAQTSSDVSATEPEARMPAAFIRMSRRPWSVTILATSASTASGRVTSSSAPVPYLPRPRSARPSRRRRPG